MLAATLRERFGVSLYGTVEPPMWEELVALTRTAMSDTSTRLGAEAAGWQYPATEVQLLGLIGQFGKRAASVLPFDPNEADTPAAIDVQAAQDELDAEFNFTT